MKIRSGDYLWIVTLAISILFMLNVFFDLNIFITTNPHIYPTFDKQPLPDLIIQEAETAKPPDSVNLISPEPVSEEDAVSGVLNLILKGTIIGEPSLAFIYNSDANTYRIYEVNETIDGLKIVSIVPAKVILEEGSSTWELLLSGQQRKYTEDTLLASSDTVQTIVMSRSDMLGELPKANELLKRIRISPSSDTDSHKLNGFRIDNIPTGSIIEKAGIKSGDVIHSVQGDVLESMSAAWKAFNAARNQPQIEVVLFRANTPLTLRYEIRN